MGEVEFAAGAADGAQVVRGEGVGQPFGVGITLFGVLQRGQQLELLGVQDRLRLRHRGDGGEHGVGGILARVEFGEFVEIPSGIDRFQVVERVIDVCPHGSDYSGCWRRFPAIGHSNPETSEKGGGFYVGEAAPINWTALGQGTPCPQRSPRAAARGPQVKPTTTRGAKTSRATRHKGNPWRPQ
ncbi:MAG: hypothetical protein ACRDQB_06185 [Thermocrispum sp.]